MKLSERQVKRMAMNVILHEQAQQQVSAKLPGMPKLPPTKRKALEKKGQKKAETLLKQSQASLRTVGDLKAAIQASMAQRQGKREKSMMWGTLGGTLGGLLFPLIQVAASSIPILAGPAGYLAATIGGGLIGYVTNVIASRNAVSGTPLEDFAVDQRILNLLSDEQEREFIQYMATVLQRVPDDTPLEQFDMTKELNEFLKTKYGIEIRDLDAGKKPPMREGLRILSMEVLVERRVRQLKKNSRFSTLLSEAPKPDKIKAAIEFAEKNTDHQGFNDDPSKDYSRYKKDLVSSLMKAGVKVSTDLGGEAYTGGLSNRHLNPWILFLVAHDMSGNPKSVPGLAKLFGRVLKTSPDDGNDVIMNQGEKSLKRVIDELKKAQKEALANSPRGVLLHLLAAGHNAKSPKQLGMSSRRMLKKLVDKRKTDEDVINYIKKILNDESHRSKVEKLNPGALAKAKGLVGTS